MEFNKKHQKSMNNNNNNNFKITHKMNKKSIKIIKNKFKKINIQ